MLKTVRPLLLPLMFGLMTLPAVAGDLELKYPDFHRQSRLLR